MFNIPEEIMKSITLTSTDKLVYAYIAKLGGQISYDTISKNIGVSKLTANNCVDRLVEAGLINCTKNSKGWNVYEVAQ